jgi:hypothetical protein
MPIARGGAPNAHLGYSVAACRNNGQGTAQFFAAGAPGIDTAFLYGPQTLTVDAGLEMGRVVVCEGSGSSPDIIAAGAEAGAWKRSTASLEVLLPGVDIIALARGDVSQNSPTLLSVGNNVYRMSTGNPVLWLSDPGFGFHIACAPTTDLCAMAAPTGGAKVYLAADGGSAPLFLVDQADGGHNVTAVAIGELHPASGLEVAIADQGVVEVYATGARSRLLYTLRSEFGVPVTGFGTSLAVDRIDAGAGLASLWIGSPFEARIYRFIGDAGTFTGELNATFGSEFGHALAIEASGGLLVTAPRYTDLMMSGPSEEGAVFRDNPNRWVSLGAIVGVQQECDVTVPCRVPSSGSTCQIGTCVGGVICANLGGPTSNCGSGDGGLSTGDGGTNPGDGGTVGVDGGNATDGGSVEPEDAGTDVDAGPMDAGSSVGDAGAPDGGQNRPDAGATSDAGMSGADAGVGDVRFTTCGCSSPALGPLLFILLALVRRRVGGGGRVA